MFKYRYMSTNYSNPIYAPGDLHKMFESIIPRFQHKYDINLLHSTPYVSLWMIIHLYLYISISLSLYLSMSLYLYISVSLYLYISISLYLYISLSTYLHISLIITILLFFSFTQPSSISRASTSEPDSTKSSDFLLSSIHARADGAGGDSGHGSDGWTTPHVLF